MEIIVIKKMTRVAAFAECRAVVEFQQVENVKCINLPDDDDEQTNERSTATHTLRA